jgi:hypothetical protein
LLGEWQSAIFLELATTVVSTTYKVLVGCITTVETVPDRPSLGSILGVDATLPTRWRFVVSSPDSVSPQGMAQERFEYEKYKLTFLDFSMLTVLEAGQWRRGNSAISCFPFEERTQPGVCPGWVRSFILPIYALISSKCHGRKSWCPQQRTWRVKQVFQGDFDENAHIATV